MIESRARFGGSPRALLLGLALLALTPPAVAVGSGEEITHETAHYLIETDTTRAFARIVGAHMEAIYKEYSRRFEDYGKVRKRFRVVVRRTKAGYRDLVPARVAGSAGVFVADDELLAAHHEGRTQEEVLRTLYHEGFHQFMYVVVSKESPIWVNEGTAEYFQEATWNGSDFTTGQVPARRLRLLQKALRSGDYIPLPDLFNLTPGQWLQNVSRNSKSAAMHYSEAWSVVHFLVHANGGHYANWLDRYLREIADGEDGEEAFERAFGNDVAAFERAWGQYVLSLQPSPKFRCRANMEALLLLAKLIYDDPRKLEELGDLRRKVLHDRRRRWQLTSPTGETITSEEKDKAAALFRCPFHQGEHGISYVVVRSRRTGLPVLICDHHPGIIIKAYYERRQNGKMAPVVEEQVRETVPDYVRRALSAARARGGGRR
ncbi:MAG: DUF1570 domain-containing protein [Planctomycetota bacterium]